MSERLLTTKDILQKDFKNSFRGYNVSEVDEYLDTVIRDYDSFQKEIAFLQNENERLRARVEELSRKQSQAEPQRSASPQMGVTNFDILKRLSNLEKHVFDAKLKEDQQ